MTQRFKRGALAYSKDGKTYTVDEVDGGIVYCWTDSGAETEFPEADLLNETEWAARSSGRRDVSYARLKQAGAYTSAAAKIDRAKAEALLAKIGRLSSSLLDFAAYRVATRALDDNGDQDLITGLSIVKSREIFDAAPAETRATLLAGLLGAQPHILIDAARLGDNLMRALIEKGLAAHAEEFEAFRDRPRK
jgi:hypothetical protein